MGNNSHIHIAGADVYIYSHLEGDKVFEWVAKGLINAGAPENVPPADYLTRIIFDVVSSNQEGTNEIGVNSTPYKGTYRSVKIDSSKRRITVTTIYNNCDDDGTYSFTQFLDKYAPNEDIEKTEVE